MTKEAKDVYAVGEDLDTPKTPDAVARVKKALKNIAENFGDEDQIFLVSFKPDGEGGANGVSVIHGDAIHQLAAVKRLAGI